MSLSRDVLITLIRSERGIDMLLKCLFFVNTFIKKGHTDYNVNVKVDDIIKNALKISGIMYLNAMFCKDCYQIPSRSGYVSYINCEGG